MLSSVRIFSLGTSEPFYVLPESHNFVHPGILFLCTFASTDLISTVWPPERSMFEPAWRVAAIHHRVRLTHAANQDGTSGTQSRVIRFISVVVNGDGVTSRNSWFICFLIPPCPPLTVRWVKFMELPYCSPSLLDFFFFFNYYFLIN